VKVANFPTEQIVGARDSNFALTYPGMGDFQPQILGRKFSDRLKFLGGGCGEGNFPSPCHDANVQAGWEII